MNAVAEEAPLVFTDSAATKVKTLIHEEENPKPEVKSFYLRWWLLGFPVWFHI